jgi:hypothetical protein
MEMGQNHCAMSMEDHNMKDSVENAIIKEIGTDDASLLETLKEFKEFLYNSDEGVDNAD